MAKRKWIPSQRVLAKYYKNYGEEATKVYVAEEFSDAVSTTVFRTNLDAELFIREVQKCSVWREIFGKKKLKVIWRGRSAKSAYGGRVKGNPYIILPSNNFGRRLHIILHEVAHAITNSGHDEKFITALLYLMVHFEGLTFHDRLSKALEETGALPASRDR